MRIAITDSNIFIDLFYLELVDHLFDIGCEIYTTRNVLLELEDHHTGVLDIHISAGRLKLESITESDKLAMIRLRINRGLAESDLSVICVAERLEAFVLTGDDLVRKNCKTNKIEIHGILWCLDQFVIKNRIAKSEACEQLKKLMTYNKRLPLADCENYITKNWSGEF